MVHQTLHNKSYEAMVDLGVALYREGKRPFPIAEFTKELKKRVKEKEEGKR